MKIVKYNIATILFVLLFQLTSFASDEFKKEITEKYVASAGTHLTIKNKYGDIDIKNWAKDSIVVKATITVETFSEEKAESLFKNIDVKINYIGKSINAVTNISQKFKTGKKFSIDYEVFMPDYIKVDLTNRFGDIYIKTLTEKVNINLSYGNLKAEKFIYKEDKPVSTINLSYAKANILECNRTKLTLKYSKVNIANSTALIVVSRYSKLRLDKNETVIADSKYDSFNITNTDNCLVSMAQYSDFKVENVNKNLELNLRYGNCKIDNVSQGFKNIKINNEYVASKISIAEGAAYMLEADTKYCGINYPDNAEVIEKIIDKSATSLKVIVGNRTPDMGKIKINSRYGNVSLK